MKFSSKNFLCEFGHCAFTEEILNGKNNFLCSEQFRRASRLVKLRSSFSLLFLTFLLFLFSLIIEFLNEMSIAIFDISLLIFKKFRGS